MLKDLHLKELLMVMRLMKERRWYFYLAIMISALCVGSFSIINSFMYKDIMNGIVNKDIELLEHAIKLVVISLILACVVNPISSYVCAYLSKKTVCDLRANLLDHVLKLPRDYFDKIHSGDILSKITNDVSMIDQIYGGQLYNILFHALVGLAATITIFILDLRLASIMVFFGVITTFANTTYAKPVRKSSDKLQSHLGKATQRFLDIVAGVRVIKLFNINKVVVNKFSDANDCVVKEGINLTKKEAEKSSVNMLLSFLTFFGVLGTGSFMVYYNLTDIGTVIAILTLKMQVFCLFEEVGGNIVDIQKSLAGAKRVFDLIYEAEEEHISGVYIEKNELSKRDTAIAFNGVTHSYNDSQNVIDGLSMTIQKDQVTALVGFSGGGKSTIIKLLLGLYVPQKGKIILEGNDDKELDLKTLRRKIAYVPQTSYLFEGSIEENIRFGNPDATKEKVINAAIAANAHDFIMDMKEGYNTSIGEGGEGLSGGQRQRIAIARAIVKDAPILLLDEATSALDSESETLVKEALDRLMKGRTTIVVAHRLSTIENANKIYVIEDGKIAEEGVHEGLLKRAGVYKLLYEAQFS